MRTLSILRTACDRIAGGVVFVLLSVCWCSSGVERCSDRQWTRGRPHTPNRPNNEKRVTNLAGCGSKRSSSLPCPGVRVTCGMRAATA